MKPSKENEKMTVSFKLKPHSVKDEFFLTLTSKGYETDILWLTRGELRKLRDVLKDV